MALTSPMVYVPPSVRPVPNERVSENVEMAGREALASKMLSMSVLPACAKEVPSSASLIADRAGGPTPRSPLSLLVVALVPGSETKKVG